MSPRGWLARLRSALTPGGSVTRLSLTSGVWMGLTKFGSRGIQLAMVLVLANLLTPTQFGVAGVAFIVASLLNRFSQLGIDAALVQNADSDVDRYLNTVFGLNIARGVLLAGLLVLVAPLAAWLFGVPMVAAIIPVMAIGPLVGGLKNPGMVYLTKDLQYHKRFGYEMSATTLQFVVAVGYALYEPTVWALVFGYVTTDVVRTVASYLIHDYRPGLGFERSLAGELIGYGKWMLGAHVANFLLDEGDDFLVGVILAPAALGFYQMAHRVGNAPATEVTHVVSDVTFPVYSKLQADLSAVRTGLLRAVQVSMLIAAPLALGMAAITPTFVRAFMGEAWLPMVVPMQLLALYGLLHAYSASFGSVWKALGRPDLLTKIPLVVLAVTLVGIWPVTTAYGIVGTAALVLAVRTFVATPLDTYATLSLLNMGPWGLLRVAGFPTVAAAAMAAVVWTVQAELALGNAMAEFAVLVVLGAAVYAVAVAALELGFDWGLRAEFRAIRRAI